MCGRSGGMPFSRAIVESIGGNDQSAIAATSHGYPRGLQTGGYSTCDSVYMAIRPAENLLNVNVTHAND